MGAAFLASFHEVCGAGWFGLLADYATCKTPLNCAPANQISRVLMACDCAARIGLEIRAAKVFGNEKNPRHDNLGGIEGASARGLRHGNPVRFATPFEKVAGMNWISYELNEPSCS